MKQGIFTTEFWLTILTNIVSIVGSMTGVIPAEIAAIIIAVANGVYGVLRAIVKKGDVIVSTQVATPNAPVSTVTVTTIKPVETVIEEPKKKK